jgi:carboxylesterase type B
MVFMHGGDFRDGYAGGPLYDGSEMVNNANVVFVAINYRLGPLGFLFTGNDTTKDPSAIHGNFGISDQREALRWVRDNIGVFGGDPTRVTISGQSAGAMSVATHLQSPASQGLFHSAIMFSDPFSIPWRNPQRGASFGLSYAEKANCSDIFGIPPPPFTSVSQCLRSLTPQQITEAQVEVQADILADITRILEVFTPWTPIYDTVDVPNWPLDAFVSGQVADVPLMIGTTSQETVVFVYEALKKAMSPTLYYLVLDIIFGLKGGPQVAQQYPLPSPAPLDNRATASQVGTSGLFRCSNRNATLTLSSIPNRQSPVYYYRYDHVMSFSPTMWGPNFTCCWNAVCHGADLTAIFHPDDAAMGTNYTANENQMSLNIQTYIGNFIHTGMAGSGPSSHPLNWPALNMVNQSMMVWQTPKFNVVDRYDEAECQLFNNIGYVWY